jgi:hypothetical protein
MSVMGHEVRISSGSYAAKDVDVPPDDDRIVTIYCQSPVLWRMVEAAGVEPASESTPSRASTCVAALEGSRSTSKSDGNRGPLAPKHLVAARRSHPRRPACIYDIQPRPTGENEVDVAAN